MSLKLEHIVAGEGVWGREVQRDAVIDRLVLCIVKLGMQRIPGSRHGAKQRAGNGRYRGSGNTHYADAADARRRGNGGDRVGQGGGHHVLKDTPRTAKISLLAGLDRAVNLPLLGDR